MDKIKTPLRPIEQQGRSPKRPNKLGDKSVARICRKIMNHDYKEPENLVFSMVRQNIIDRHQFTMLVQAIPRKSTFIYKT